MGGTTESKEEETIFIVKEDQEVDPTGLALLTSIVGPLLLASKRLKLRVAHGAAAVDSVLTIRNKSMRKQTFSIPGFL